VSRIGSLLLLLLCVTTFSSAATRDELLPTAQLSKEARSFRTPLKSSSEIPQRRSKGAVVRDHISEFVVRQLGTMPSISQRQLQTQLRKILCSEASGACDECNQPPYVFASDWGPKTIRRQVALAYMLDLGFVGPGGTLTVVESYLWENGTAKRIAGGGSEFDGYIANFQQVSWLPDAYWLLAWGTLTGSSGRGLSGRAALYRVGVDAVKTVWFAPVLLNVTAQRNAIGWEVNYADQDRLYDNAANPWLLDIYSFDNAQGTYSRVVHYQY
jgi:hypothetical protein